MCFAAHSAYAREPPAMAMMTTNAPSNAKNKISAAFDEICSAITWGDERKRGDELVEADAFKAKLVNDQA